MKNCELCNSKAKLFCGSDRATLCWDCDARVHGANFLVAKHSRTLLCHLCQSPTPWTGSGPKLGPTISVCHNCSVTNRNEEIKDDHENEEHEETEEEDSDDEENQVVPVPRLDSSSSQESSTRFCRRNRTGDDDSVSRNKCSSSFFVDRGNVEK